MSEPSSDPSSDPSAAERRRASSSRRMTLEDRRNAERVAEDLSPRRNPEAKDRRKR